MINKMILKTHILGGILFASLIGPFAALAETSSALVSPPAQTVKHILFSESQNQLVIKNRPLSPSTIETKNLKLNQKIEKLRNRPEGGVGSGGGTGYRGGLLDLALHNTGAFQDRTLGSQIKSTASFKKLGFDRLNNSSLPVLQMAHSQVLKWFWSSPEIASRIANALQTMPIYFVSGTIQNSPLEYHLPANSMIDTNELSTLGVYIQTLGNFTSKESFEALSEKNQIAYLIHESIRHLQIDQQIKLSNKSVQNLTAKILENPKADETLDTAEFMTGTLSKRLSEKQNLENRVHSLSAKTCKSYQLLCEDKDYSFDDLIEAADHLKSSSKELQQMNQISADQSLQRSADQLEIRAVAQLQAALGVSRVLSKIEAPLFRVDRDLKLGTLDLALSQTNTGKASKEQKALLEKVRLELTQVGLIN